jgi:hypothetical protein
MTATSLCLRCHRPVAVPARTATELPKEPRHIGVPGNPTDCP